MAVLGEMSLRLQTFGSDVVDLRAGILLRIVLAFRKFAVNRKRTKRRINIGDVLRGLKEEATT